MPVSRMRRQSVVRCMPSRRAARVTQPAVRRSASRMRSSVETSEAAPTSFGRSTEVSRSPCVRTTALSFLLLVIFLGSVPLVSTATGLVIVFAVWGVAMAGVMVTWNLGPLHFAPEGQGSKYASVHVFLVGVRSTVAPMLGYAVAELLGLNMLFWLSAGLMATATVTVWMLRER